jgi:carbonic anhydrase/acetyltransferase-like protein (isoleucine patch superfamily)
MTFATVFSKRAADVVPCPIVHVMCFFTRSSPTGLSAATTIGAFVTVGAGSLLRSCVIQDNVMIGKKCIVMEGAVVCPFA